MPNLKGSACQVALAAPIVFKAGTAASIGLPNTVGVPRLIDTTLQVNRVLMCADQDSISLSVADSNAFWYQWEDGSTTTNRKIGAAGTYWIERATYCHKWVDTFVVTKVNLDPLISVNGFELSTTNTYAAYQWYLNGNTISGATQAQLQVLENGDYTVRVSNDTVCSEISPVYTVTNVITSIQTNNLSAASIKVCPNPAQEMIYIHAPLNVNVSLFSIEGKLLLQVPNAKQIPVNNLVEGIYFIHIYSQNGQLIKTQKIIK